MRGLAATLLLAGLAFVAACGDTETTVINQTTTVTAPESATTSEAPAGAGETVAPTTPTPRELQEPSETTTGNPENYTGPCGEPGAVTGGEPGTSATTAIPGFANLETRSAPCTFATTVASEWVDGWDASCASGCTRPIQELRCEYGGSGTSVRCISRDSEVSFDLVFEIE